MRQTHSTNIVYDLVIYKGDTPIKLAAVITEYNPFHNGHLYQLQEIRKRTDADAILVLMSGDFVQRGAPACVDKYLRCHMALSVGADIVCELPVYGALGSAELFAESAVSLLNHLGCVKWLCFGAETDQSSALLQIAKIFSDEPAAYRAHLQNALRCGHSYPTARSMALSAYLGSDCYKELLNRPNNILAIEYIKALYQTNSTITPVIIKRMGADYHSPLIYTEQNQHSSATAIRAQLNALYHETHTVTSSQTEYTHKHMAQTTLKETIASSLEPVMPNTCISLLSDYLCRKPLLDRNDFSEFMAYRLMDSQLSLTDYIDVTPELAQRINHSKRNFCQMDSFIANLDTRNFTATRISRCLFRILLGHTKEELKQWKGSHYQGYLHVLGFRKSSSAFWKEIPENFRTQMITQPSQSNNLTAVGLKMYQADMAASELYRQMLQCRCGHSLPPVASEGIITL